MPKSKGFANPARRTFGRTLAYNLSSRAHCSGLVRKRLGICAWNYWSLVSGYFLNGIKNMLMLLRQNKRPFRKTCGKCSLSWEPYKWGWSAQWQASVGGFNWRKHFKEEIDKREDFGLGHGLAWRTRSCQWMQKLKAKWWRTGSCISQQQGPEGFFDGYQDKAAYGSLNDKLQAAGKSDFFQRAAVERHFCKPTKVMVKTENFESCESEARRKRLEDGWRARKAWHMRTVRTSRRAYSPSWLAR